MNFKNTLIFSTIYPLFLYLLYKSEDEIKNTLFIASYAIPNDIRKNLPNNVIYNPDYTLNSKFIVINILSRSIYYLYYKHKIKKILKKSPNVRFHSHDESVMTAMFIGKNTFIQIEDGLINYIKPKASKNNENGLMTKFKNFLKQNFLFVQKKNNDSQIIKRIYTKNSPYHKDVEIISITNLWNNSSSKKKRLILEIFGIDEKTFLSLKKKKTIILTQPLSEDKLLDSEDEKIKIYKNVIDKIAPDEIVLKTHPREKTDYRKYFSDVLVFDKPIPAEIFELAKIKFSSAYTVSSTIALNFNYDINIIPIDTKKNTKGEADFRHILSKSL
ncbi:hypothetical protein ACT4R9_03070 [Ornithobacterium rhinotracheale]|uniref:hypothetical protein n=1 Tax=Ornithobacterium rhinotracheale TaxID=28251 RepID=UPI003FA4A620